MFAVRTEADDVMIRCRLAPSHARYAEGLVAGVDSDGDLRHLETALALREGGDEGLCVS